MRGMLAVLGRELTEWRLVFLVALVTGLIPLATPWLPNLGGIDPFAIEPHLINQYGFTYVGKEKIDELELYVFDVQPKSVPDWKKTWKNTGKE